MPHDSERFKEIRGIGQGQFGQTLLVEDRQENNRTVVIKIPIDNGAELALINDLVNNAVLSTSLRAMEHPNIVKYLGFGKYKGLVVLILEYVDGKDLSTMMGPSFNRPPMDIDKALRISIDVCSGLVAAHNARVLHSDLKPANILIRESDGVAKLCDFGVSSILRSTSAAQFAGTLLYSAPELLAGKASFQADIWSLAVILYEMVTGVLPFPWTGSLSTFKEKVDREDPAPPKRLNPEVDDRLNAVILRGLEKDINKRFKKAQDMLTALQACTVPNSETPTLPPGPVDGGFAKKAVGALSAIAFLAAAVFYVRRPPEIEAMTCSPCVMEAGKTTTLSWKTKGASKVVLESLSGLSPATKDVENSGSLQQTPKQRTTYTLVGTSRFGATARSAKITVTPLEISFSSLGTFMPMLFWNVSEPAAKVSISSRRMLQTSLVADNLAAQGSRRCEPSTEYTLSATVDGVTLQKSTYVTSPYTLPISTYDIPSVQANMVGPLLFFQSKTTEPPEVDKRKYETLFTLSPLKRVPDPWIWWQLKLKNDGLYPPTKFPIVGVWYKKKRFLESYDEVFRSSPADLESPPIGKTNTYRGPWNGGTLGWGMKVSTLSTGQETYRVELYVGLKKIATGDFSVKY